MVGRPNLIVRFIAVASAVNTVCESTQVSVHNVCLSSSNLYRQGCHFGVHVALTVLLVFPRVGSSS